MPIRRTPRLNINDQCPNDIDTSQLISRANQLTGSHIMAILVVKINIDTCSGSVMVIS